MKWIFIAIGSVLGGVSRYALAGYVQKHAMGAFPFGTIAVNITGCFLVGLINGWAAYRGTVSSDLRLLMITGFCGAFTTFSAFTLETVALAKAGDTLRAMGNVVFSIACCLVAFLIGDRLMRW